MVSGMNPVPTPGVSGESPNSVHGALLWQAGAGLLGMMAAFLRYDVRVAAGLGFGVLIVMLTTLMLGRRIQGAAAIDPESGQRMLYAGAVMRFVLVLAALLVAFGLDLHLFAVAVGMLLAQAAMFMFAARGMRDQIKQKTV